LKYIVSFNEAFGSVISPYNRRVRSIILEMICDEAGITDKRIEKDIKKEIKNIFFYNPEVDDTVRRFESNRKREIECANHIYKWFIKESDIKKYY
jgi:hypothetical protein